MHRGSRKLSIATAVAIAVLALSAVALGAKPVKGATYKGHYGVAGAGTQVSFKVSANGKTVSKMHFGIYPPNKCGAGGPPPKQSSKPAKIKNGKFKVRLTYTYSGLGGASHTYTVTGQFLKGKKEKGVFIYKKTPPNCNLKTPYTTTAK